MIRDAVDSYANVPGAVLRANGIRLAMRYLSDYTPKNLTNDQRVDAHANGVATGLNWEGGAQDERQGYAAGHYAGMRAAQEADALGAPHGLKIYYSADFDLTSAADFAAVREYMRGARDATSRAFLASAYGEADLLDDLHAAGLLGDGYGWQTLAWSYARLSAWACLYQFDINDSVGGHSVDNNAIILPSKLGVWAPEGSPLHTSGATSVPVTSEEGEDDMAGQVKIIKPPNSNLRAVIGIGEPFQAEDGATVKALMKAYGIKATDVVTVSMRDFTNWTHRAAK